MQEPTFSDVEKALRVKEQVSAILAGHPNVTLVDIGYDPTPSVHGENRLAVRVHVNHVLSLEQMSLPDQIEDIPVRVVTGSYHLE
jgi:hypothetical protein